MITPEPEALEAGFYNQDFGLGSPEKVSEVIFYGVLLGVATLDVPIVDLMCTTPGVACSAA